VKGPEDLESWGGTQRRLPVLVGVIWMAMGALVIILAYPDFQENWTFLPWGAAMALGGLAVLYIRLSVLPSTRRFQAAQAAQAAQGPAGPTASTTTED
jgi:uncharacterized membrane protein HdeD (DUF308 family)